MREYQICANCVMDTTDSKITFDEKGVCDHCNDFYKNVLPNWHTDERGRAEIEAVVTKIKKEGEGKDLKNAFIVADDIEYGFKNKIPLWLFGFMY